jgi:hypothetical protein
MALVMFSHSTPCLWRATLRTIWDAVLRIEPVGIVLLESLKPGRY